MLNMEKIREPVGVMGEVAKGGIDNGIEIAKNYGDYVRKGRTPEENFANYVLSGFVGLIGLLLFIYGYTASGIIILIIAYIISVLPGKRDR